MDEQSAPDFIAVAGRDGSIVGYARKEGLLASNGADIALQVYAEDLRTVIGQMVPGKGFVPAGVDPASVPDVPVQAGPSGEPIAEQSGRVVVYVRNDADAQAWIAVDDRGRLADNGGFWRGNIGVSCLAMSDGSRLLLLNAPPDLAIVAESRVIYARGHEAEAPPQWISVGRDGSVSQGRGVPAWWPGDPQTC